MRGSVSPASGGPLLCLLIAACSSLAACAEDAEGGGETTASSSTESGDTGASEASWTFELGDGFVDLVRLDQGDLLVQFVTDSECCEGTIAHFALARLSSEGESHWVREDVSIADDALMPQGMCAMGEGAVYLGVDHEPQGEGLEPKLGFVGPQGELTNQALTLPASVSMPASPDSFRMSCVGDGGYWIASTFGGAEAAPFVLRYDAQHELVWSLDYSASDTEPEPPSSITEPIALPGGGFALVETRGGAGAQFADAQLSVHAPDSEVSWTRPVGEGQEVWGASLSASDEHIFVQSSGEWGTSLAVLTFDGELVTSQIYSAEFGRPALGRAPLPSGELLALVADASGDERADVYELGTATQLRDEALIMAELEIDLSLPWYSLGGGQVLSGGSVSDTTGARVGQLRFDEL